MGEIENKEIKYYMDFKLNRYLTEQFISVVNHSYFRTELIHTEKVPPKKHGKPRIFFSNHSGMSFPWDAIVFSSHYWEHNNFQADKFIRPLAAPMLSESKWMSPYMIDNFWRRGGALDATMENFEYLMEKGEDVLIYPEGVPGIGKGFDRKYQIQNFSTSFLRMAVHYDADLIPIYTINAEYCHPYSYKNDRLNRFVQRLGVPFLPLSPITALVGVLPWAFYFSLPAKIHFVFGDPIAPQNFVGGKEEHRIRRKDYIHYRDEIHWDFQKNITKYVEEFGEDPYQFEELKEILFNNIEKSLYILPFGWPVVLTSLVKEYDMGLMPELQYTIEEFIRLSFKHPEGFSFTLPFGWSMVWSQKKLATDVLKTFIHFIEEELHLHKNTKTQGLSRRRK
ncbi:MAG: 1-acyl-sn-glycerol-3-phosphate acyltransferase [Leptospiraceae bacterium]|nr:1-acyl-sn-glycerol-3-phosphate acyltransferase [Leptospiraceae bacterium]MCP5494865.1 1-acyl-sn-glycerol-3-phosphate acyltransferase [Leptospiraceae bacterium]